jgi:hypothetical protein
MQGNAANDLRTTYRKKWRGDGLMAGPGAAIEGVAPDPARADGELPDAQLGIRRAIGALRSEAPVHLRSAR